MSKRRARGQSAVEYVVVLAAVAAALLSMAVYMKRGVSGNLRGSADSVGEQYHPKHISSDFTQRFASDTTTSSELSQNQPIDIVDEDGNVVGTIVADTMATLTSIEKDTSQRTGSETVGALTGDLWD